MPLSQWPARRPQGRVGAQAGSEAQGARRAGRANAPTPDIAIRRRPQTAGPFPVEPPPLFMQLPAAAAADAGNRYTVVVVVAAAAATANRHSSAAAATAAGTADRYSAAAATAHRHSAAAAAAVHVSHTRWC